MLPTQIQNSPLNPDGEVMVLMRTNVQEIQDIYFLGQTISTNIDLLSKKFILRAFQFAVTDQVQRNDYITNDLKYYSYNIKHLGTCTRLRTFF